MKFLIKFLTVFDHLLTVECKLTNNDVVNNERNMASTVRTAVPVSYTHLDVYKRQLLKRPVLLRIKKMKIV